METNATKRSILEASPSICLQDVHTSIKARGLPILHKVTFKAQLKDQKGIPYISFAYYKTDGNGFVDLDTAASLGGSYEGVFPAGLLTTLNPAPGQFEFHRLAAKDPSIPWKIHISVHDGFEVSTEWSTPIDEIILERHLMAPGVRRIKVNAGKVRGVLYLPPGGGPFPGIIDMFGGVGGCVEHRSAMLASRGIASLALAYFKYEDLPKTKDLLEMEYFEEAVDYLLSVPGVISNKCGVIGTCFGGYVAIMMGVYLEKVKFILTINASSIAANTTATYKGKTVYTGGCLTSEFMTFDEKFRVLPCKKLWEENLIPSHPQTLPIHKIDKTKSILLVVGDDDSMLGPLSAKVLEDKAKAAGIKNTWSIIYHDAGHMIEPPYGPLIEHSFQVDSETSKYVMYWGGKAKGTCDAQEHLWKVIQEFFKNNFTFQTEMNCPKIPSKL